MGRNKFGIIFVYGVMAVVAAAVVAGFFIVGSPAEERLRRFDERRVGDLQFLQSEIIAYWQKKNVLPPDLASLRDDIRGIYPPRDPETDAEYSYETAGALSFSLCANFSRPSANTPDSMARPVAPAPYYYDSQNWEHGAGRFCFSRTIDKDIYSLKNQK